MSVLTQSFTIPCYRCVAISQKLDVLLDGNPWLLVSISHLYFVSMYVYYENTSISQNFYQSLKGTWWRQIIKHFLWLISILALNQLQNLTNYFHIFSYRWIWSKSMWLDSQQLHKVSGTSSVVCWQQWWTQPISKTFVERWLHFMFSKQNYGYFQVSKISVFQSTFINVCGLCSNWYGLRQ